MSKRLDQVALRCPTCGSLAAGRVDHHERLAGKATVKCIVCKREVSVPAPLPFPQSWFKELGQTFGLYGAAFKRMGWGMVLLLLGIWAGGGYLTADVLHWPTWVALGLPAIPFLYFFSRAFAPLMQAQIRGEMGVLRMPEKLRGLSQRDPLPAQTTAEQMRLIQSRACPRCGGSLRPGKRTKTPPVPGMRKWMERLGLAKKQLSYEQVEVMCKKCDYRGAIFFQRQD